MNVNQERVKYMKYKLLRVFVLLWTSQATVFAQNHKDVFFENISKLCGHSYNGKTLFPNDPTHAFAGKTLTIKIAECTDREIRIPFKVGKDTSRTWILSKTEKGLLFKHDHRHEDGTPHDVTLYGGYASTQGTTMIQSFPADKQTHQLVPEGKTNVWTLSLNEADNTLTYFLERHNKPRYKAVFDLSQ